MQMLGLLFLLLPFAAPAAPAARPAPPVRVRVLTYNIHHGEGTDRKLDLPRIAKVIKGAEADVVALQEVDVKTRRTGGVDQPGELAKLTGMRGHFGKSIDFGGGQYGNAILSRFPTTRPTTLPLPAEAPRENRSALSVEVTHPQGGARFLFAATHLDHLPDETARLAQVKLINEKLAVAAKEGVEELPALLTGDLNATPGSGPIQRLLEHWTDTDAKGSPTYPSDNPRKRIDYVLCRPAGRWRVVETRVIEEKVASDHRPVLVVLELLP
jgi:endonuclease/exonuclease/phosphatase family metal-dependent hydrolase